MCMLMNKSIMMSIFYSHVKEHLAITDVDNYSKNATRGLCRIVFAEQLEAKMHAIAMINTSINI